MDSRALDSFRAVYESGSISKAAASLFISPQGLSKTIARLEAELDVVLFERSHSGVKPTSFADSLYRRAVQVEEIFDGIRDEASRAGRRRTLLVPAVSGVLSYLGLDFIAGFEREHPGVRLRFSDLGDASVDRMVTSGRADIAFMSAPIDREKYDSIPVISEPHVLIVGADDRLARRESVTFADLDGRLVMLLGQEYSTYDDLMARLRAADARPGDVMGVVESDTAYTFAARGQAVFISARWWAHEYRWRDVVVLPIDEPGFSYDVHLVKRRGFPLSGLELAFRDYTLEFVACR